jgi:hypothetical protein
VRDVHKKFVKKVNRPDGMSEYDYDLVEEECTPVVPGAVIVTINQAVSCPRKKMIVAPANATSSAETQ